MHFSTCVHENKMLRKISEPEGNEMGNGGNYVMRIS